MSLEKAGVELVIEGVSNFVNGLRLAESAYNDFSRSVDDSTQLLDSATGALGVMAGGVGAVVGAVQIGSGVFSGLGNIIDKLLAPVRFLASAVFDLAKAVAGSVVGGLKNIASLFKDIAKKILSIPLNIKGFLTL